MFPSLRAAEIVAPQPQQSSLCPTVDQRRRCRGSGSSHHGGCSGHHPPASHQHTGRWSGKHKTGDFPFSISVEALTQLLFSWIVWQMSGDRQWRPLLEADWAAHYVIAVLNSLVSEYGCWKRNRDPSRCWWPNVLIDCLISSPAGGGWPVAGRVTADLLPVRLLGIGTEENRSCDAAAGTEQILPSTCS